MAINQPKEQETLAKSLVERMEQKWGLSLQKYSGTRNP